MVVASNGAVEQFIIEQMHADSEEGKQPVRFTVRIDPASDAELRKLADHLGMTKMGLATGLLEAAIDQARYVVEHGGDVDDVAVGGAI